MIITKKLGAVAGTILGNDSIVYQDTISHAQLQSEGPMKKFCLGKFGKDHFLKYLSGWENYLLDEIVNVISSIEGRIYSIVPEGTSSSLAEDFQSGGLVSGSLTRWMSDHCQLELTKGRCLYFADLIQRIEDEFLQKGPKPPLEYLDYRGQVVYFTKVDEDIYRKLDDGRHAVSAHYVGFLSIEIRDTLVESQNKMTDESVDEIICDISHVFIDVYDNESILVWERNS